MKQIGYVYKYDEVERMGILAYGYASSPYWRPLPILFSKEDCVSQIKTGDLVYFVKEENNTIAQIEKASLWNFDKDLVERIVSCYDNISDPDNCYKYTNIRFEDLNNLLFDEDNDIEELPTSIIDLHSLFGKYYHEEYFTSLDYLIPNGVVVDILNIDNWIDSDNENINYYGKTVNEVIDLINLFVCKRKENYKQYYKTHYSHNEVPRYIDSVPMGWKYLLSKLSDEELTVLCKKEQIIQPALPLEFCKRNLPLLTYEYGFPSKDICKSYYIHKVMSALTVSEFFVMYEELHKANDCPLEYKKDEGVHLCQLSQSNIKEVCSLLEKQFSNNIISIIDKLLDNSADIVPFYNQRIRELFANKEYDYLLSLGLFIEKFGLIQKSCNINNSFYELSKMYKNLYDEDKEILLPFVRNKATECLLYVSESVFSTSKVHTVSYILNCYSTWISPSAIQCAKELLNEEFCAVDNLEDLKDICKIGIISNSQFLNRYIHLTQDYSISQLIGEIHSDFDHLIPVNAQHYLVDKIIKMFQTRDLNYFYYVQFDNITIWNNESLKEWLINERDNECTLDSQVVEKAIKVIDEIPERL